jgi:putative RNA 2'-phosphotransferase
MIRMCEEHGYFRGEVCPVCGMEGKFIMNDYEQEHLGKTLAGALRHFPEKFNLTMDPRGWVDIQQFVNAVKSRQRRFKWLRAYHVVALIKTDPKGRYQYKDGYIRATYGHTIDVDLDFPTDETPDKLYYPATEEEADFLKEGGLRPSDRMYVHLSTTLESAVEAGKVRSPRPVVFEIDAKKASEDGIKIMHAAPTIFITKEIPPEYIKEIEVPEELLGPEEEEIEETEEQAEGEESEETTEEDMAESEEETDEENPDMSEESE